jgi:N-acyl amino acid synthase of PEP-CTERM/exosortase system
MAYQAGVGAPERSPRNKPEGTRALAYTMNAVQRRLGTPSAWQPANVPFFRETLLDNTCDLNQSFRLRYRVYCEEMQFLPAEAYPDGLETDSYDSKSLHFGSFNTQGVIVGAVRLVHGDSIRDLPMQSHCPLYPHEQACLDRFSDFVEISRLVVSRDYRRRAGDGQYGLVGAAAANRDASPVTPLERRSNTPPTVVRLYRAMYHALKRRGIDHVVASMEWTLYRTARALRIPFREIGPESDYYGPVRPFYLRLEELDVQLNAMNPGLLQYFNDNLDPKYQCVLIR